MSRPKKHAVLPWLTAKWDGKDENRFIQVGNALLLSKKFQALKPGAQMLYLCMAMDAGEKREFAFPHKAAKKYGISSSSFERWTEELIEAGFIEKIEDENFYLYTPNKYRFNFAWKAKPAPQNGEGKP